MMDIASPQAIAYRSVAAMRPTLPTALVPALPAPSLSSLAGPSLAAQSARVQLSPLGQVAGAVGALLSSASASNVSAAAASASRIAQAIAVLDQSISSLGQVSDGSSEELDFLSGAEFSQRTAGQPLALWPRSG